jgi:hypothetical protein
MEDAIGLFGAIGAGERGDSIPDGARTLIKYPKAIWDDQLRRWVSDAGPPAPPAAAAEASSCTCPNTGTARPNGSACSRRPAARPGSLTSPGQVTAAIPETITRS